MTSLRRSSRINFRTASGAITIVAIAACHASALDTGELLFNQGSHLCMGIAGSSGSSGANAVQGTCASTPSQIWTAYNNTTIGSVNYYQIANHTSSADSPLCLAVDGASSSSGASIVQKTCATDGGASDHSQVWTPINVANANNAGVVSMYWKNGHSGLCIAIQSGSHSSGAQAVQISCTTSLSSNDTPVWTSNIP